MTTPTTQDLRTMLDEACASVNGPWIVTGDESTGFAVSTCGGNGYSAASDMCIEDARLIAAAPDLAAEVIRLREERDRLREGIEKVAIQIQRERDDSARLIPTRSYAKAEDHARLRALLGDQS